MSYLVVPFLSSNLWVQLFFDAFCHSVCGGPCSLKVEAARDAVDVKHFASIEEMGRPFRFEGLFIDAVEGDSSTSDKLIFVGTATCDLVSVVGEQVGKSVDAFFTQLVAAFAL